MPWRPLHSYSRKMGSLEKLPAPGPGRQEALFTLLAGELGEKRCPLKYFKDQFRAEMCTAQMV